MTTTTGLARQKISEARGFLCLFVPELRHNRELTVIGMTSPTRQSPFFIQENNVCFSIRIESNSHARIYLDYSEI